jgi:dolichol-phosphate mannosyltransferase
MATISVILPIYNEETLIEELVSRVVLNLQQVTEDYEIILIDDGSIDESWKNIVSITEINQKLRAIKFSKNFGHHYAISAGLKHSSGDWVIVMDSDLQDRPEVIPDLYRKTLEGYDVVFVSRKNRPENWIYLITQRIYYFFLNRISGIKFDSNQANFSIISRKVVESYKKLNESTVFYGSSILWLGFKRTSIDAVHGVRHSGKPSYTFKKRVKLGLDIVLSFSDRPLKFAILLGLMMSLTSLLLGINIVYRATTQGFSVVGWSSLIATIFFTSGIVLVVLGIIGLYLGEVFKQVKNRPQYIIDTIIN